MNLLGTRIERCANAIQGHLPRWQANLTWLVVGVTVVGILGGCFVYLYATGQVG